MPDNSLLGYIPTYRGDIFFLNEKWDRLRTIGQLNPKTEGFELVFLPVRQRLPGLDEHTHPEMKYPATAEFLSSFNTLSDACDFMNEPYLCNVHNEPPVRLGHKLKYLLRKSNNTYPRLLTDIADVPSSFSVLDRVPMNNPYFGYYPILDIQAYDDSIRIIGGPISSVSDWPAGYQVRKVSYPNQWSSTELPFQGFVGDDIILPPTVDNELFGNLVKLVWWSQINSFSVNNDIIRHLTPAPVGQRLCRSARAWFARICNNR